jgi:hypothetical protein
MWTFIGTCSLFKISRNRHVPFGDTTGKGADIADVDEGFVTSTK